MCGGSGLITYILYRYTLFSVLRHCSVGNLSFTRKNDYSRLNGHRSSTLARPTSQNPSCRGVELPSSFSERCCTSAQPFHASDQRKWLRHSLPKLSPPLPYHAKVYDSTANHPKLPTISFDLYIYMLSSSNPRPLPN